MNNDTTNINSKQPNKSSHFWKYNEDKILKQLEEYIAGTYRQHYVDRTGDRNEQTLDKIKHNRREGFCAGNITKYIDRYDTKGTPRADLFKVLHYTILLINHLNLIENK
jgi:Uma2 family endonuclease